MNWGWPFSYMQDIDQKTSQPVDVWEQYGMTV